VKGFVFALLCLQYGPAVGLVIYYFARLRGGD